MRKIAVVLLVLIVLLQCGMKTAFVAYYQVNKEYIAAVLCENKDNVSMNCKGKCYLNKKIKEQEKQENKLASILKELKDSNGFLHYGFNFSTNTSGYVLSEKRSAYLIKAYSSPLADILHPPC